MMPTSGAAAICRAAVETRNGFSQADRVGENPISSAASSPYIDADLALARTIRKVARRSIAEAQFGGSFGTGIVYEPSISIGVSHLAGPL